VLVPRVDVTTLVTEAGDAAPVAAAIDAACRDTGFFSIVDHGLDPSLRTRLDALAREFFALPEHEKGEIAMSRGGRAWRGWFPVGGELTSGVPDRKEGIYFGAELHADDPRVREGLPLHGPNLFPRRPAELRDAVLDYLDAMTRLGHAVMRGVALGLGLPADWFRRELTRDPTILFRIFCYPPASTRDPDDDEWGVREHTDYGLLTILAQDGTGGLQVRSTGGWVDVPADPDAFVCNIGDMLERMTGGRYRSTPHRVRNTSGASRLSFPFFFDPGWDADVRPVPEVATGARPNDARSDDAQARWDGANVHELTGTYGEYLLAKVSKVFPALTTDVL
jgi:isopenicillin N synthase-like dioxygenase